MDTEKYVMTFKSTHYAIMSEKKLENFKVQMIPTPREISASCGLSITFEKDDFKEIISEIKRWEEHEEMLNIYVIDKATKIAEEIGEIKAANMAALGVYIGKSKIIPLEKLEESLSNVFQKAKKELLGINLKTLKRGEEIGKRS